MRVGRDQVKRRDQGAGVRARSERTANLNFKHSNKLQNHHLLQTSLRVTPIDTMYNIARASRPMASAIRAAYVSASASERAVRSRGPQQPLTPACIAIDRRC